ncbi:MAG TPA: sirohydrochlorin nickelochelatase [Methanocorpusculum sp.]|nr:sirohydrochlorin nickelochelatase [Methanocorpusculum sp.]
MAKYGILLIGHGSRLEYNKQLTEGTAEMMRNKCPAALIRTCFLEHNHPDVKEGLEQMRDESVDVLVVLPFLLSGGVHVLQNIPRLIGLDEGEKSGTFTLNNGKEIPLVYADPVGADPLLAELLLKNADAAVQDIRT